MLIVVKYVFLKNTYSNTHTYFFLQNGTYFYATYFHVFLWHVFSRRGGSARANRVRVARRGRKFLGFLPRVKPLDAIWQ